MPGHAANDDHSDKKGEMGETKLSMSFYVFMELLLSIHLDKGPGKGTLYGWGVLNLSVYIHTYLALLLIELSLSLSKLGRGTLYLLSFCLGTGCMTGMMGLIYLIWLMGFHLHFMSGCSFFFVFPFFLSYWPPVSLSIFFPYILKLMFGWYCCSVLRVECWNLVVNLLLHS